MWKTWRPAVAAGGEPGEGWRDLAKTRNSRKRGRPRLDGAREPNGRLRRGGGDDGGRAVGATPEQTMRRIAAGMLAGGMPGADGKARGGLDMANCPLDWLHAAGLVDDAAHRVMMRWRELHRRICGAPAPASREKAGSVGDVTPEMQREWKYLSEVMSARERAAVFAIAVEECWPAWLLARDGWGGEDAICSADGKRCHLFRNGVAALVTAEAQPIQVVTGRNARRLTEPARGGNVRNGVSISGPETDHDDASHIPQAQIRTAGR